MAVSVVSLSFSMAAQPEHWLSLLHSSLSAANYTAGPQLYSPVSTGSLNPTDRNSTVLCSIRRPYITFKLPRGDMGTPLKLLSISSDRDVSLPLSLEWPVWSSSSGNNCHPVQRSLSSGARVYESIMDFFTSSHFISQFPPTRFPLITAIRMCHFLPVHYLEWHFGRVNRSKHNTLLENWKTTEHKNGSDTNCNWCARYSYQRIDKVNRRFVNKRASEDHLVYSILKIDQNNNESWRLEDTCCYLDSNGNPSANVV